MNNLTIRLETEKDYRAVEELTREAFWNVYKPGAAELLSLIFWSNAKRSEGKNLLALAKLVLKPCLRVHDVADDFAVNFKNKSKLGDEVGMRAHRVDEIVLVRARLVDIPKRLACKFFYCSVIFFGF